MKQKQKKTKAQKYERKPKVHCVNCKVFVNVDETEFVNIEEDIQGVDVMTYICPHCKKEQKSKIFG